MRCSRWTATALTLLATALAVPTAAVAADATLCTTAGTAFDDTDRDGILDPGESGRAGDIVYLYDETGGYLGGATTDAAGRYVLPAVACGTHVVEYAAQTWWSVRADLVPTTTGSVLPRRTVTGTGEASFGWRPIVRSTTAGAPLSSYTGPEGLRVESYDDVVVARELYDALLRGSVGAIGAEAAGTTVRFDLGAGSTTSGSAGATNGTYDRFAAICSVSWLSWLDGGDTTLVHEYGHAWSLYRAYVVQQDPALTGYLAARGLTGDPRLGSNYAWSPRELVAEDYRQLFGSGHAAAAPQANYELPPAAAVAGLRDYLVGPFSATTTAAAPSPSPTPSATPSPTPSPTASPSPSPTVSPSPTASPSPTRRTTCRQKRC